MGWWRVLTKYPEQRHNETGLHRVANDAGHVISETVLQAAVRKGRLRSIHAAERWFFPAAALYGAAAVPMSVYGMVSGTHPLPAFGTPMGHAHELLFGYALAVAAGFLLNKISAARMSVLFGLWLAARVTYLLWPHSLLAAACNFGFALLLAGTVAPKLLKGAKKLRNKAFGPVIVAISITLGVFHVAVVRGSITVTYAAIEEGVLLFSLLMLFMGGRIIAPAIAAAFERAGGHLEARIQPRIEGMLLASMVVAILGAALPGAKLAAGTALLTAGVLAAVRLVRWRVWHCPARPDLLCLGAGYAWLAVGLCLLGSAWAIGGIGAASAIHALTIGALGTLTSSVMTRIRSLRAKRDPAAVRTLPPIVMLIALAAGLRIGMGGTATGLGLAAAFWSAGLMLLAITLLRSPVR